MATSYKNIVITPNIGNTADPKIQFSGGNTSANTDITLYVYPNSNGSLSFEGSAGQLFSITNDLTGSIFSVNDVSGIPSIDVNADGTVELAPFGGVVGIGTTTPTTTRALTLNNANNYYGIDFQTAGTSRGKIIQESTGNMYYDAGASILFRTNPDTTRLTIDGSGNITLSANLVLGSRGISANGGFGTAGQVLHSNGSATYWATDDNSGGTVTSVAAGTGLSGGTITTTGTLSVNASYIATLSANNTTYLSGVALTNIPSGDNGAATSGATSSMNDLAQKSGYYWYNNPTGAPEATYTTWMTAMGHVAGDRYGWQLSQAYWSDALWTRRLTSNAWQTWRKILDSGNYSSYALPLSGGTVTGRIYSNEWIQFDNYTGIYSPLNNAHFYPNNGTYGSWYCRGTRNSWAGIEFYDSSTTLMMNTDNYGFHYNGVGWRMYVTGGSLYVPGNITAYWSDRRLKENLRPIGKEASDILSKLTAYRFNWNDKVEDFGISVKPGKEEIGLIAQEVQAVLPDAVEVNKTANKVNEDGSEDEADYLTINWNKITPLLVQALNDTTKELNELKQLLKDKGLI